MPRETVDACEFFGEVAPADQRQVRIESEGVALVIEVSGTFHDGCAACEYNGVKDHFQRTRLNCEGCGHLVCPHAPPRTGFLVPGGLPDVLHA